MAIQSAFPYAVLGRDKCASKVRHLNSPIYTIKLILFQQLLRRSEFQISIATPTPPCNQEQTQPKNETDIKQDYILTPYIAEVINTLTNLTYRTSLPHFLTPIFLSSPIQLPCFWLASRGGDSLEGKFDHENSKSQKNQDLGFFSFCMTWD